MAINHFLWNHNHNYTENSEQSQEKDPLLPEWVTSGKLPAFFNLTENKLCRYNDHPATTWFMDLTERTYCTVHIVVVLWLGSAPIFISCSSAVKKKMMMMNINRDTLILGRRHRVSVLAEIAVMDGL